MRLSICQSVRPLVNPSVGWSVTSFFFWRALTKKANNLCCASSLVCSQGSGPVAFFNAFTLNRFFLRDYFLNTDLYSLDKKSVRNGEYSLDLDMDAVMFFFHPQTPPNNPETTKLSQFWSKFQKIGYWSEEKANLNPPESLLICTTAPYGARIWHLVTQNGLDICLHWYILCLMYLLLTFDRQPKI